MSTDPGTVATVVKAFKILEAFGEDSLTGIGVSALARRAMLPKTTTYRLLKGLEDTGAVERIGRVYRIGYLIQNLGAPTDASMHNLLREALTPALTRLYEETGETVHLASLVGTRVVYLNKLFGQLKVHSPSRLGGQAPAYCTGVGKALLAFNQEAAELASKEPLKAWTAHTCTDPDRLLGQLAEVRTTGVAFDREELASGLVCVAAPVFDRRRRPLAALSVSGSIADFDAHQYADVLRPLAFTASQDLQLAMTRKHRKHRSHPG